MTATLIAWRCVANALAGNSELIYHSRLIAYTRDTHLMDPLECVTAVALGPQIDLHALAMCTSSGRERQRHPGSSIVEAVTSAAPG